MSHSLFKISSGPQFKVQKSGNLEGADLKAQLEIIIQQIIEESGLRAKPLDKLSKLFLICLPSRGISDLKKYTDMKEKVDVYLRSKKLEFLDKLPEGFQISWFFYIEARKISKNGKNGKSSMPTRLKNRLNGYIKFSDAEYNNPLQNVIFTEESPKENSNNDCEDNNLSKGGVSLSEGDSRSSKNDRNFSEEEGAQNSEDIQKYIPAVGEGDSTPEDAQFPSNKRINRQRETLVAKDDLSSSRMSIYSTKSK